MRYPSLQRAHSQAASAQVRPDAPTAAAARVSVAFQLDPFEIRTVDIAICDDMLYCLGALRSGRADLYTLITDGDARVRAVIDRWGLRWPAEG